MAGLLRTDQQDDISSQRRMKTDNINSDALTAISGESVTLKYYSAGVPTVDAGQASGVVVVGKLANSNILSAIGDVVGSYGDTSVVVTSTALTEQVPFDHLALHRAEAGGISVLKSGSAKAVAVTAGFKNGQYCIDHDTGTIYAVKADATTAVSVDYSVLIGVSGGGGGISSDVNIESVGGVDVEADADGFIEVVGKSYDSLTQSDKVAEINPLNMQYASEVTEFENVLNATPEYAYVALKPGYKFFTIQAVETGGTDTVTYSFEATCLDDGTAAASCPYIDKSADYFGGTFAADFLQEKDTPTGIKYLRVKVTTAGGANDWDGYIVINKYY